MATGAYDNLIQACTQVRAGLPACGAIGLHALPARLRALLKQYGAQDPGLLRLYESVRGPLQASLAQLPMPEHYNLAATDPRLTPVRARAEAQVAELITRLQQYRGADATQVLPAPTPAPAAPASAAEQEVLELKARLAKISKEYQRLEELARSWKAELAETARTAAQPVRGDSAEALLTAWTAARLAGKALDPPLWTAMRSRMIGCPAPLRPFVEGVIGLAERLHAPAPPALTQPGMLEELDQYVFALPLELRVGAEAEGWLALITLLQSAIQARLAALGLQAILPAPQSPFDPELQRFAERDVIWTNTNPAQDKCVHSVCRLGFRHAEAGVLRKADVRIYRYVGETTARAASPLEDDDAFFRLANPEGA